MASTSGLASGRPIRDQAREIVYNVSQYFRNMKQTFQIQDANLNNMTSDATGVTVITVKAILREVVESSARGKLTFSTPTGKENREKENNRN